MNIKTAITKIHYDKKAKGFLFTVLKFFSLFYGIGATLKNIFYDKKILKSYKVNAFVISVGNLTTGGVGKTPVVAEIAKYLISHGEKVAIISRGYGGALSNKKVNIISDGQRVFFDAKLAGDEPFWLAVNTGAVVITSKNRVAAANYAIENFGVTKIILDDGFQHRKIHRDMDIVLVDSEKVFGNEKLLPAGPLREGMDAFARVDRLIIVSKNFEHSRAEKLTKIMEKKLKIPTFLCKTEPDTVYNIKTGDVLPEASVAVALSAIGQPEQFYNFLSKYSLKNKITFDDHHQYVLDDVEDIDASIITTEKDAVKLKDFDLTNIYALKLKTSLDISALLKY